MTPQIKLIAQWTGFATNAIENVLKLSESGATIPFISRYRKEQTGNLDEVAIQSIIEKGLFFEEIEKRKLFILETIKEQGKLTSALEKQITDCYNKTDLEDLYLPYKVRKKTKADLAIENGLEPLAKVILEQKNPEVEVLANRYKNELYNTVPLVLEGAKAIVAQWISNDLETRNMLRERFEKYAVIQTKPNKKGLEKSPDLALKYKDYLEYNEKANYAASHRIMAVFRAEEEGVLKLEVSPDEDKTLEALDFKWLKRYSSVKDLMQDVIDDSYKRLLKPSIENEYKTSLFEKAEKEALKVFSENLKQLLLSPPLGNKAVLAIDPGIRTGCKTVCLNKNGVLQYQTVLFFNSPSSAQSSLLELKKIMSKYNMEAIAIGNGTAGRDVFDVIKQSDIDCPVFLINEDGASIYSASEIARKEFPDLDVTVRGAISIGRRLMDPLAELVKIDPKSLGVGQYQHDVDGNRLKTALNDTIEWTVNRVGVNVNTAGEELLKHVSGLGPLLAKHIVEYRAQNGPFKQRSDLKKVSRMGEKAFEQSAGFLRVKEGSNPLDASGIHPEKYAVVEKLAKQYQVKPSQLMANTELIDKIKKDSHWVQEIGVYTFNDIMNELLKPGLDPRNQITEDEFDASIRTINDLVEGMFVKGIVTNITNFGAFIDIGIKQKGLLHISEMSNTFVQSPHEVIKLNQRLTLKVKEIDIPRMRIALSLKE